ncbi:MAG TPA: PP2C family serine/threonine-protein phosphatase [Acidimicrobiia bacterium]|nr:PP2C family serine/threonine-protein phosphatase [Acidimicrobiia bacterium]
MNYVWGTGTHVGRVRTGNEDSLHPAASGNSNGPAVLMVADGMGGAVAGEVASRLAVEAASVAPDGDPISPEDRVLAANTAVIEATRNDPSLAGMGTTMTLVVLREDGTADFAHVGDSRAYLLRDGVLRTLTTDHTLVNELMELGRITPKEAESHPHRHLITRVLGLGPIAVDTFSIDLEAGDRILLCSDGLNTMVSDFAIQELLAAGEGVDPTVWALIEQANTAGGLDNTTVVLIDVRA